MADNGITLIQQELYRDAKIIIDGAITANRPQEAVRAALKKINFTGNLYLAAIGKAAWTMAHSAFEELGDKIKQGIVITKYGHSLGDIAGAEIIEAGHPLPDDNSIAGTVKILEMAEGLGEGDELLFLVSGGGSALFEQPLAGLTLAEIADINSQLLTCGAGITETNMIRKRLSAVKAGRFAKVCSPAKVFTVALSDVLGGRLDTIACGPASPDMSTSSEAIAVIEKYKLNISDKIKEYLKCETPKSLDNTQEFIIGSVYSLCGGAADIASSLGYVPHVMCCEMDCEAREAGRFISAIAKQINAGNYSFKKPCAVIFGGETVVNIRGKGKGGRNQELALAAAEGIAGLENTVIFSIGSDGTDGPTDVAGGIVDGYTKQHLKEKGFNLYDILNNNDSYNGLNAVDSLIKTGPTGTNVNDIAVILCK